VSDDLGGVAQVAQTDGLVIGVVSEGEKRKYLNDNSTNKNNPEHKNIN
jgi:hypothetical protein